MNVGADVSVGPNPSASSGQLRVDTEVYPYNPPLVELTLNRYKRVVNIPIIQIFSYCPGLQTNETKGIQRLLALRPPERRAG